GRISDELTVREYHAAIQVETDRLERLVNRLLESHRIQSGQNRYHMAPHSILEIAGSAASHLRAQAVAKGMDVVLSLPDTRREVDLDRTAFEEALENLIDNAIKY